MFYVLERGKDHTFFMNAIEQLRHAQYFDQWRRNQSKTRWRRLHWAERMRRSAQHDVESGGHYELKRKSETMVSSSESSDDDTTTLRRSSGSEDSNLFVEAKPKPSVSPQEKQRLVDESQRRIQKNYRNSFENMKG